MAGKPSHRGKKIKEEQQGLSGLVFTNNKYFMNQLVNINSSRTISSYGL
jgi:hypothetical protein